MANPAKPTHLRTRRNALASLGDDPILTGAACA